MNDNSESIYKLCAELKRRDLIDLIPSFTSNTSSGNKSNTYEDKFFYDEKTTKNTTNKEVDNLSIKKDIFFIEKGKKRNKKKKGRISNEDAKIYSGKHNKCSEDNLIKKVKVHFVESCFNYLNFSYQISTDDKNKVLLYKINSEETKKTNKTDILKWLDKKLKDIFSHKNSKRCSTKEEFHNKNEIQKIYDEKNEEMIAIFEKKVRDMYKSFIENDLIEGFNTLDDDLEKQRKEMIEKNEEKIEDIEEYLEQYKKIALELEDIVSKKTERQKNKDMCILIDGNMENE